MTLLFSMIWESTTSLVLAARIAISTLATAVPCDKRDGGTPIARRILTLDFLRDGMSTKLQQYGQETRYRLRCKHSPWCTHVFIAFFGSRQAAYMREQFIFRSYAVPTAPRKRKPDTPRPHVAGEFCANDHLCTCAPVFTAPSC